MKKIILVFACVFAQCAAVKIYGQTTSISSSYNSGVVIAPSNNTRMATVVMTSVKSFNELFPNLSPSVKSVKGLGISTAKVESSDPAKNSLGGIFKSIKTYIIITMPNGSNQTILVSDNNVPKNTGNRLALTLNSSVIDHSVNGDKINPNGNIAESLSGRLSGVQVDAGGNIRVRGVNSTGNGTALVIVDGIERNGIQGLNPNDIVSVEVLKEPVQLAMYGVKGANGVIVVKTKGGSNSEKNAAPLDNFARGSSMRVKIEYILREPLSAQTSLNLAVNFVSE